MGRPVFVTCVLAAALAAFGLWLWPHASGIASGADQAGYMGLARSLSEGKLAEAAPSHPALSAAKVSPWTYVPLGFAPVGTESKIASVYPPGLPAFYALAYLVGGNWELAARLVSLAHALAALFFCYRLGRAWHLPRQFAAAISAVLALSPLNLRYSMLNMSDGPAMTWALAAMYFATKSQKRNSYAAWAGVCFALGIAVRPTNVLMLPALVMVLQRKVPALGRFVLAAGLALLPLFFFNTLQFGSPFKLGYGNILWRFKPRYFLPRAWHFFLWLSRFFTPLVFLGVIIGIVLPRNKEKVRFYAFAGILWFGTFFLFYGFYWFSKDAWWSLRFLLPAIPGLLLASAEGFAGASERIRWKRLRIAASLLVAGMVLGSSVFWVEHLRVRILRTEEGKWRQAAEEAGRHYQVVLCGELSGAVFFYTPATLLRFDRLRQAELASLLTRLPPETRVGALVSSGEIKLMARLFPGLLGNCAVSGPFHLCEVNRPK